MAILPILLRKHFYYFFQLYLDYCPIFSNKDIPKDEINIRIYLIKRNCKIGIEELNNTNFYIFEQFCKVKRDSISNIISSEG